MFFCEFCEIFINIFFKKNLRWLLLNQQYMKEQNNLNKTSNYLQNLDANNLNELAMNQTLPSHGFALIWWFYHWKNRSTSEKNDKHGYILKLDGEYPRELQKKHNKLPILTERMKIGKMEKLVPNLKDK